MKKRVFASLLILVLLLSASVGCGKKVEESTSEGTTGQEQDSEATTGQELDNEQGPITEGPLRTVSLDGTLDGSLDKIKNSSWAKDKSPVTIKWFVAYDWFSKTWDPEKNWGDKKLLENTGITVEVTSGNVEKLNTLIASGKLPDMITYNASDGVMKQLEDSGMLYPLDELKSKYAPEMDVLESMMSWFRNKDGHWYRFASYFVGPERANPEFGGYFNSHNGNWVREDILEQINMTKNDMHTKEGFMKALEAVKEQKIEYNGKAVTPFMLDYWFDATVERFAEQFGVDLEDKEGNFVNVMRTEEYLESLLFLNEMYRKGLFTDEEFTMDKTQKDTKIAAGQVFAINGLATSETGKRNLWLSDENAKLGYAGVIEGGNNGQSPIIKSSGGGGWCATVITKNCENPDRAAQLLSYLSQEEIMLDNNFGTGVYQVIDGKVKKDQEFVEEEKENPQAFAAKYSLNLGLLSDTCVRQKYEGEPTTWFEKDKLEAQTKRNAEICNSRAFDDVNPEGGTELAGILERLRAHMRQTLPIIIMASSEKECIEQYDVCIKDMDKLGMKELDIFRNERFRENKVRMGIEYVWPRNQ